MSKQKNIVVTFPKWGNYTIALGLILKSLGVRNIPYHTVTKKHLETGVMYSPETICFCFKPVLGGLLECINKGANTLFWWDTYGQCRARYYPLLQKLIFKKIGHDVDFLIFDKAASSLKLLKKLSNKSYFEILKKVYYGYELLKLINLAEKNLYWHRTREKKLNDADKAFNRSIEIIKKCHSLREIRKAKKKVTNMFLKIKVKVKEVPKILIIGEIYLIHNTFANHNLLKILGNLGFEVHVTQTALDMVKHVIRPHHFHKKMEVVTMPYLSVNVGGHARESIMELILRANKGYSGVIHVSPFGCMPEVTVNPILQKIAKKYQIPYLFLTFDVQTGDVGLITRLEAFADLTQEGK